MAGSAVLKTAFIGLAATFGIAVLSMSPGAQDALERPRSSVAPMLSGYAASGPQRGLRSGAEINTTNGAVSNLGRTRFGVASSS